MDIEITKLTRNQLSSFISLIHVFEKEFEWEHFVLPSGNYLQTVLDNPSFIVFVAMLDKEVVGGLTAHVLNRYDSEKPSAYIYDIAVLENQQRKGIGKLLIKTLSDYCVANGFSEAYVQAETDDLQAVNFYKSTRFTGEMNVTHFTYSF